MSVKFWIKVKKTTYIHFLEDVCEIHGIELGYDIPVADAHENWKCISRFRYTDLGGWISVNDNIGLFKFIHDKVLKRFLFNIEVIIDEEFLASKN